MASKRDLDLIRAAAEGEVANVVNLLEKGAHVNARHKSGTTALLAAALSGHAEVVNTLIVQGADLKMRYRNDSTALILVAIQGDTEMVKLLISRGADVDARAKEGTTALLAASATGNVEMVRTLLDAKASLEQKDHASVTPLLAAIANDYINVARLLVDAGADVNADCHNGSALQVTAAKGDEEMLRLLLGKGARTEPKSGQSPLMLAAANSHLEAVRILVQAGADVNVRDGNGVSPLLVASVNGQTDMVKVLLNAQANPNALATRIESGETARGANGHAAENDANDFVPAGASMAADVGTSPLMVAALHGHTAVVEALLSSGADPNVRDDRHHATALGWADFFGREEMAELIRGKGGVT